VAYCADPGPPWVTAGGDCHDGSTTYHPGAPELCDGGDNDCDGLVDQGGVCR
jgi:hypothetical protein